MPGLQGRRFPGGGQKEGLGFRVLGFIEIVMFISSQNVLVFFWLALRTLTFWGFYMNYNKEAKSLTLRRGSEVSQVG